MLIAYILGSVILVSLISLAGAITLALNRAFLQKILIYLVSFSAGALLGGAILHLIPEAFVNAPRTQVSLSILGGILFFFILEGIVHWRHCHIPSSDSHPHHLGIMNLTGDALHNFIDGTLIASSFLVSIPLGLTTTVAVILHEIPQEIGDFGVLLYAGYARARALMFNFLMSCSAILGALSIILLRNIIELPLHAFFIPLTAGGFIYIAGSDLIPELRKECGLAKSFGQLFFIVLGMGMMFLLRFVE